MKKKTFIVQLLDSKKPSRTSFTQIEDAKFYSNDTDASLVFIPHEDTFDFETAKVVMFNRGDESLVERDAVVTTEDGRKVASYELPDEIISHWGEWIAQPVFISGGEIYSGAIVPFSVERHLMHERPPKLTEVVTVTKFVEQSQELVNAMIQAEAQRITEEQDRQSAEENRLQAESERSEWFETTKPEVEESITKSDEAITKSQNALNVANGIDAKATNALSLSESADTLSKSVQEQFNQVIIDGDSSVEAAQARVDASGQTNPTLKARLDKEHNEVTTQLAQNVQESGSARSSTIKIAPSQTKKVYLTLTDDDVKKEVWTKLKPVAEEFDVPITLAVPVRNELSTPDKELTKAQILELQNDLGWEMASHSWTHSPQMRTFTDEQLDYELGASKRELESWGLKIKNFIAPFGVNDTANVRRIASKYYNCTPQAGGIYNLKPVKNHNLQRLPFGSFTDKTDFNYFKNQIDNTILNGGWLILMMHCAEPTHDASQTEVLRQIIQYAQSQNVEIVNLQEGFEHFGNMIEVEGVTSLDNRGYLYGKQGHTHFDEASEVTLLTTPQWFRDNYRGSRVASYFRSAQNQSFPESKTGTLITFAYGGADDVQQEWRPNNSNKVFKRYSINATVWSTWVDSSLSMLSSANAYTNASAIASFPANKITYTKISSASNSGFPTSAGTVITNTLIMENGYYKQEFHSYNDGRVFERFVNHSGLWTAWREKALKRVSSGEPLNFGTIAAHTTKEVTVNSSTLKPYNPASNIIINPIGAFPAGLMCMGFVASSDLVTVRVANVTGAEIVAGNLTFTITHI